MNYSELEQESARMSSALLTQNRLIIGDLITYLRKEIDLDELAGLMLVSLERILWTHPDTVLWFKNFIPQDLLKAMRKLTLGELSKRLIAQGFIPGKDFSLDGEGNLILSEKAERIIPTIR